MGGALYGGDYYHDLERALNNVDCLPASASPLHLRRISFDTLNGLFFCLLYPIHKPVLHRHRSSVNFRGARYFCPRNMYEKLTKCPNFTWFLPEKLSKYPNFYDICPKNEPNSRILHDFCPKNARILHNNCPKKIFSRFFFGGGRHVPPAPRLLRL